MANEQAAPDQLTEEVSDQLGSPDSQEESDDWSPDQLSAEDRARYDAAVQAIDSFIEKHPEYKATEENRQAILDYLESHDLPISKASLDLVWEQIGDRLDLEEQNSKQPDEADASARLATAALARGTKGVEPEDAEESEPEPEEPKTARGKPVAWRNGRAVSGVGS